MMNFMTHSFGSGHFPYPIPPELMPTAYGTSDPDVGPAPWRP